MNIDHIFHNFPTLETERLILRKPHADDAPDFFAYASDPEVAQTTTWSPHSTVEESAEVLALFATDFHQRFVITWGIEHRAEARFIGTCGLTLMPRHHRGELGYALARPYWGQGLMTEAVRAVITFGFLQAELNRIEARCLPSNIGSERVMQKAGMILEGILREQMLIKGDYQTLKLYAILRREWLTRTALRPVPEIPRG